MMGRGNVLLFWKLRGNEAQLVFHTDRASALAQRGRVLFGAKGCRAEFDIAPRIAEEVKELNGPLEPQAAKEEEEPQAEG